MESNTTNAQNKSAKTICPICFYPKPPSHEDSCELLSLIREANQDLAKLVQEIQCLKSEK